MAEFVRLLTETPLSVLLAIALIAAILVPLACLAVLWRLATVGLDIYRTWRRNGRSGGS